MEEEEPCTEQSADHARHSLSREFQEIGTLCKAGDVSLEGILLHLEERGLALIILFFGCPFMLPIPLPGVSVPFGIMIMIFGISLATGWKPYLPQAFLTKKLPVDLLVRLTSAASRLFQKVEKWFKPRWNTIADNPLLHTLAGLCIAGLGLLLALPLPPGTNAPPAIAIVALSIGLLEKDGLLMLIGFGIFALNILFFTLLTMFGYEAALRLLHLEGLWR